MPFFKTAYTSTSGSSRNAPAIEDILHFNGVRIRVNGAGSLKSKLWSLDNAREYGLTEIPMSENQGRQPTILANAIEQRIAYEGRTENINDYFRVNRIIIFSKFYASEYPM